MDKYEPLTVSFMCYINELFTIRNRIKEVKMRAASIKISAGTSFSLPIIVPKSNIILYWSFHSKYYEIDFSIVRKSENNKSESVIPVVTCPGNTLQQGKVSLSETGAYYLVWDNSRSWIREKTVIYSVNLKMPEIGFDERILCSREILRDQQKIQFSVTDAIQVLEEKEKELTAIDLLSNQRKTKRELSEIALLKEQNSICEKNIGDLKRKVDSEYQHIKELKVMSPFLLEDERILSMLDSRDILHLACVNKYLHDVSHQDVVWMRLFKCDSRQRLAIALKNEWLLQKWRLANPLIPAPSVSK